MISANRLKSNDISSSTNERTVLITLKGAPDIVIQRCSSYKTNDDQILPLTIQIKEKLFNRQETLGKHGYRIIAVCQQKMTQKQYDQRMLYYESRKYLTILTIEDLNGFPEDKYCFLGFFCLLDSPRIDSANAVVQIHRVHIRVATITGDHSTTASTIGKQVNIFSPEISERNGIDTMKMDTNQNGQIVIRLYRNNTLLEEHIPQKVTPLPIKNPINRNLFRKSTWYKRFWLWFENQFRQPESILIKEDTKRERIPYAIIVSLCIVNIENNYFIFQIK